MAIRLKEARDFVYSNGVLWEQALFAYLFQDAGIDRLHQCLRCYKNTDCGFGHALEHDLRCPDSHPAALEYLLGALIQFGVPPGTLLDGAAHWVERIRRSDGALANPPTLSEYPLAPWWAEWGGQSTPDSITGNLAHIGLATASLQETTAAWASEHLTVEAIRANEWLFMAYHAFDYLGSPAADHLPDHHERWKATLENIVACAARAEPKQYYELFRFAPTPNGAVTEALPAALLSHYLDHLQESQDADGGWHDEHGLPQWRPIVTIAVLHGLRSHGRSIGSI